jgi:hypothetical protein
MGMVLLMGEDVGEYEVCIRVKGKRLNAHFLVKDVENCCDLAEKYLDLKIEKKIVLKV